MPSVTEILDTMDYGPAPEANGHVLDWLAAHADGFGHFIGGSFARPAAGDFRDVSNPANGELLARGGIYAKLHELQYKLDSDAERPGGEE